MKRRRASGRRTRGRRSKRRRVGRRVRISRGIRPSQASFMRYFWKEDWPFNNASTSGFARQYLPSFNDLPNVAEYVALFDVYKINAVKISFKPRYTGADANGTSATNSSIPYMAYYVDPESNYALTGLYTSTNFNQFCENAKGRVKERRLDKPFSVYWKPKVSVESYTAGNPGAYAKCPWLSTVNYPTVPMRMLNCFVHTENFVAATLGNWGVDVFYTIYFQVKGAK